MAQLTTAQHQLICAWLGLLKFNCESVACLASNSLKLVVTLEWTQATFSDLAADLTEQTTDSEAVKADKARIRPQHEAVIKQAQSLNKDDNSPISQRNIEYAAALSNDSLEFSNRTYYHLGFFAFTGLKATSFKRYLGTDPVTLSKNFTDVNYRGGQVGLGVNYTYGMFLVGLTYAYADMNNFDLFTRKEYTLRNTQTSGAQTLIDEKKITAYSGEYNKVSAHLFNADAIVNIRLDSGSKNHVLIDVYTHVKRPIDKIPRSTDVGLAFYFFKKSGRFMGGLYGEVPDIKNNYEQAKPPEEQDFRPISQRVSFGFLVTASLGSILNGF